MNSRSTEINDEEKEDKRSQRKTLMVLFVLFFIILFLLLALIVFSAFLVHKSGHSRPWNPFEIILRRFAVEDDLSCAKPDCVETCYTMDNEYVQRTTRFSLNESFHIARTEFKVEIQATGGSLMQIHMISPTNRMIWDLEFRLLKNTINLISDVSNHNLEPNKVKVENVTNIGVNENFFLYAKPLLNVNHTLTGFHFEIQALNRSKISLGELPVKLELKELADSPEVPYHLEIYGPFLIFGYCTSTKTHV